MPGLAAPSWVSHEKISLITICTQETDERIQTSHVVGVAMGAENTVKFFRVVSPRQKVAEGPVTNVKEKLGRAGPDQELGSHTPLAEQHLHHKIPSFPTHSSYINRAPHGQGQR